MSLECMARVWKHAKCNGTPLVCLLALADWANQDDICWYSVLSISMRCRNTERAAQKLLSNLVDGGQIFVKPESGQNNYYLVTVGLTIDEIKHRLIRALKIPRDEASKIATDIVVNQIAFNEKIADTKYQQGARMSKNRGVKPISGGGETHFGGGVKPISPDPTLIPNDPKDSSAANAAPKAPTSPLKNNSSASPALKADCEIYHIMPDGTRVNPMQVQYVTAQEVVNEVIAYSTDKPDDYHVVVRDGKDIMWYKAGKKVRKPTPPDKLKNAIAWFCFKASTQAEQNLHMGRIGRDKTKEELLDYLTSLMPNGQPPTPEYIDKVALSITQGSDGLDNMGQWWDKHHIDSKANLPLERPGPLKFGGAYVEFRKWRLGQKNKTAEEAKPQPRYVDFIEDDDGVWRPWIENVDRLPVTYKRYGADIAPEPTHANP